MKRNDGQNTFRPLQHICLKLFKNGISCDWNGFSAVCYCMERFYLFMVDPGKRLVDPDQGVATGAVKD